MGVVAASPPELVGRAEAWSYLQRHLEAAFDGRGGAVRVVADAGVGKSALLEAIGRSVAGAGAQVLTTQGRQSEEHLTFAALHRLIEPLWEHRAVLPPGHQTALADAFGLTDEERVPQRFFVALAVLELLTAAAASTPLVAIVDDRQWLDSATRDVIDFIARRVAHESILIVYGERPSVDAALPPDDLGDVFALRVLEPPAAEQLLDLAYPALAAAERAVVLEAAGGNPLALIELPRSPLGGDPRSGRQSGHRSVSDERSGQADPASPVAHRLREVFLARVAALPDDSRLALLVAALQDADTTVEVLEAVTTTPGARSPRSALAEAEQSGLARIEGQTVRFRHPLVRAAVVASSTPDERRRAHEALAGVVAASPHRAEWHRGSAVNEPKEESAEQVALVAERGAQRGDAAFAHALFERAVRLSTDQQRRSHRLLRVAELAYELGHWDELKPVVASIRGADLIPVDRARLVALELAFDDGAPEGADAVHRFVMSAHDAIRAGDHRLAGDLLVVAARNTYWGASADSLGPHILEARDQLGDGADVAGLILVIESFLRPFTSGTTLIGQLGALAGADLPDEANALFSQAAYVIGDFQLALTLAQRASEGLRREGRLALLAATLVLQAFSSLYLGRWDVSYAASQEAYDLAVETRQPVWAACAKLGQANLMALRGQRDAATALAAEVQRVAVLTGNASLMNGVQLTRGLAALGAGEPAIAFTELARMFDRADAAWQSPQCVWAIDYLAEAAIASGHTATAREILAEIEAETGDTSAPGVRRAISLARLMLADPEETERAYDAASRVPATAWHRARRDLAYGSWLRRHRDSAASRALLTSAAAVFEALDAPAWAKRADGELSAAGVKRTLRLHPESWSKLSAQELQVALLAAAGLSNREIADRLYLSHRTVSSHLYHAYPKLGITSRSQLHLALDGVARHSEPLASTVT